MTCPRRKDRHVACLEGDYASLRSSELHLAAAAGDAEYFVDTGMVVNIVVDAIAPAITPSVAFKKLLEHRSRVK